MSLAGQPAGGVPPEYVVGHVQEALGTDARVGEWGLVVDVGRATLTIAGVVATKARQAAVAIVAEEALCALGCHYEIRDTTEVAAAAAPTGEEELS